MRTRRSASSSSDPVSSSPFKNLNQGGQTGHRPVLLHEVLRLLDIQPDDSVVDATLGGAGHARALFEKLGPSGIFIGVDADAEAIKRAEIDLSSKATPRGYLEAANFRDLDAVLAKNRVSRITKALFDLGWSGDQLSAGRGFSFLKDEPLLMTYANDSSQTAVTAATIVNTWSEKSIATILEGWGEERHARGIAKRIVDARQKRPIKTSRELGELVASVVPRRERIHPATRTFQALRIAVNDELGALKEGLHAAWTALAPGGRIAVISFHSVEDREVKLLMREWIRKGEGRLLTKSPVIPRLEERRANPRSRSAKLRVIQKIKNQEQ